MELREWLIILGLALVSLIVVDGVRRLQRQRRVPRLDQAVDNLPKASMQELDDEAKEAEINWELPNGGARVVKPADYSGLGKKPRLERQEHPGPSKVLSDFRRSISKAAAKSKSVASGQRFAYQSGFSDERAEDTVKGANASFKTRASSQDAEKAGVAEPVRPTSRAESRVDESSVSPGAVDKDSVDKTLSSESPIEERREPGLFADEAPAPRKSTVETGASDVKPEAEKVSLGTQGARPAESEPTLSAEPKPATGDAEPFESGSFEKEPLKRDSLESANAPEAESMTAAASDTVSTGREEVKAEVAPEEPVLRAEPEDAAFAKSSESRQRRQLRSNTAGELDDDAVDEYRLVDFEGMGRSFKRRLIEHRQERARKKAEKAERAKALAKQKAERKALEVEQRREAKEAAEAEKARIAHQHAKARDEAALASTHHHHDDDLYSAEPSMSALRRQRPGSETVDEYDEAAFDEGYDDPAFDENVVRPHPTLEKALRHDVSGAHAKETLTDASEMVVISVLSRDEEGFDGSKLLELMMACGLRYSRTMGVFHRFETESDDSELQFSMVNVVKPGTFPIEEMGDFATPGVTFLMPLPGALDSAAAFEAMVETAMVVVRHMGGELKDENHSVMTAQTIEFARQRVHEFERRHRLQRHTAR